MARKRKSEAVLAELRAFGLGYPEAHTKSPWPGHLDLAVRDKTFAYLSVDGQPFSMTCKLPESNAAALTLPATAPAGYGLGKSGWVAAHFSDEEMPPIDVLKSWIDESYRAVAPKKLAAQIGAPAEAGRPAAKPKKGSKTKPAARVAKKKKKRGANR
jgi:predicted DNA-binding protein (MmcQ/YjbR family)